MIISKECIEAIEYIEVTLRPFKNKIAACDEAEKDEERTEE